MKNLKTTLIALGILATSLVSSANAQYDYDPMMEDPMAGMERLMQEGDAMAQMQYQQFQQTNAAFYQAAAQYYREQTGDYTTPDAQAGQLGEALWCQNNPGQCQGAASNNTGQKTPGDTYSEILDIQHKGYMDRSAMTSEGQSNYVQGAIYSESTFINPNSGAGYSLPVYPDQNMSYTSPEGYPLSFNYQTNTWYQGDGNGGWYPLNAQR